MRNFLALAVLALSMCGCSMSKEYVQADEDTYNAVWPVYEKYYKADPTLTPEQVQSKDDLGITWKGRIDEAKKGAK